MRCRGFKFTSALCQANSEPLLWVFFSSLFLWSPPNLATMSICCCPISPMCPPQTPGCILVPRSLCPQSLSPLP